MTTLTVFVGIIAFSNVILLVGLAVLAFSLKRVVDDSISPALSEVNSTIKKVEGLVENVDVRTVRIMDVAEETVRRVSGSVVATSDVVECAVVSPFITLSSVMAGISKAREVWHDRSNGNGA
jgi:uncharacterized protein YoxC